MVRMGLISESSCDGLRLKRQAQAKILNLKHNPLGEDRLGNSRARLLTNKSKFESFPHGNTARKLGRFPAPTARWIPARDNAPGIVPTLVIRPIGVEDPAPLQGGYIRLREYSPALAEADAARVRHPAS